MAVVVQLLSCVWLFVTPWTVAYQASLPFTISQSLLKLMSIMIPSNHLILCHPLLLMPSIFPSVSVSSSESVLGIRWPKCRSFSFSISSSNKYSGLIFLRIDWFDLAVQGTVKSLLQHHNRKPQYFCTHHSLCPNSHIATRLLEKAWFWLYGSLSAKWCLCFLICYLDLSYLFFQGVSIF